MARPVLVATELRLCCRQSFSTTSRRRASVLFALSSLSNSRETQHFNKLSRLSRVEHSPSLKLIKMSEVDTFAPPKPAPSVDQTTMTTAAVPDPALQAAAQRWDREALNVGRAVLAQHAEQMTLMKKTLEELQERESTQKRVVEQERLAWRAETERLRSEVRVAGAWIVVSIATATALATWRFWPHTGAAAVAGTTMDAAVGGATAREVASVPESVTITPLVPVEAPIQAVTTSPPAVVQKASSGWKSLFWKQN